MDSEPQFNSGGIGVPLGPTYVNRKDIEPVLRPDAAEMLIRHMAAQDPERLERDRAEAWGCDPTRLSPDTMTVTFDRTDEK